MSKREVRYFVMDDQRRVHRMHGEPRDEFGYSKWQRQMGTPVGTTKLGEIVIIKTVFDGRDFSDNDPPRPFRTIVYTEAGAFARDADGKMYEEENYPTWEDAEAGHKRWESRLKRERTRTRK